MRWADNIGAPRSIARATRIALARRTVTAIILPYDLQDGAYEDPPRVHGTPRFGVGYRAPKIVAQTGAEACGRPNPYRIFSLDTDPFAEQWSVRFVRL